MAGGAAGTRTKTSSVELRREPRVLAREDARIFPPPQRSASCLIDGISTVTFAGGASRVDCLAVGPNKE